MKKNKLNIMSLWTLLLMTVFSFTFAACSDDDSAGGTPEITGVKILSSDTTTYSYDEYYTKAGAGSMIAVMGNNLGEVLHAYINDQEVSFNSTMNTAHSIILTVPSEADGFKLSAFNSNVPDEIRLETTHGTAVYAFKITAPGPQLQRIDASYPREKGDTLKLYGLNLVDVEKIFITDTQGAALDTTVWEADKVPGNHTDFTDYFSIAEDHHLNPSTQAYETASVLGAVMPENAPDSGSLVVQCAGGTTYLSYYKRPGKPVVTSISNDMPEIGEDLIITGREFVQVASVTYGDVTLSPDEFVVSETQDTITIPFEKKPSADVSALTVTTPGGQVTVDGFYDKTTILTTFDDDAINNGWGPDATYEDAGNADGQYAHINVTDNGSNYWGTMIYFRKDWSGNGFSLSDNIPSSASADDVYFAYNVFDNNSDFNSDTFSGMIRYLIQPIGDAEFYYGSANGAANITANMTWINYQESWSWDRPILADISDQAHKGHWYRVVVPLSKFPCFAGLTYADIVKKGINQFRLMEYNEGATKGKVDIKVDNVRVIYVPGK